MSEDGTAYITSGIRRPNNAIPSDGMNLPRLTPIIQLRQNAKKGQMEETFESESDDDDNMEVEYLDQDEEFIHTEQHEEEIAKPEIEVQQPIKLPVKKRITKLPAKPAVAKVEPVSYLACQICGISTTNQETFFAHLKSHYEPPAETTVRPVSRSPSYESIEIKVSFFLIDAF